MSPVDFLTIFTIMLAIYALIYPKRRKLFILKFRICELRILAIVLVWILILTYFVDIADSIDLSYLKWSFKAGWPEPQTWAFLLSLGLIIYILLKLNLKRFPEKNLNKVQNYYLELLRSQNYQFLKNIIKDYHHKDISKFLIELNTFKVDTSLLSGPLYKRGEQRNEQKYNHLRQKNLLDAQMVYNLIVTDSLFIKNIATSDPYFFTAIIHELRSKSTRKEIFVNEFLGVILDSKNVQFKRELMNPLRKKRDGQYEFGKDQRIMKSLTYDIDVAAINHAWKSIGDMTYKELEIEAQSDHSILRNEISIDDSLLWDYNIKWAINYFDFIVRAAIAQEHEDNMTMHYYSIFVRYIIKNMKATGNNDNTWNYKLLEDIVTKIKKWHKISVEGNYQHINSILNEVGHIVYEIGSCCKLDLSSKNEFIMQLWEQTIFFGPSPDDIEDATEAKNSAIRKFIENYKIYVGSRYEKQNTCYEESLNYLWESRNITDYPDGNDFVDSFKDMVIDEL